MNDPKRLADHYKRYLENQLRKEFPFEGIPVKCIFKRKNEDRSELIASGTGVDPWPKHINNEDED